MAIVLINLSKYILTFLILFYTYTCFSISSTRNKKNLNRKYIAQNIYMMLIFIICFSVIIYKDPSLNTMIFFTLEFMYLILLIMLYYIIYPASSRLVVNNMAFMIAMGFIMVERLSQSNAFKQFLIVIIGTLFSFFIPAIMRRRKFIMSQRYTIAILGIMSLAITLIIGNTSYGANLSISIMGYSFQTSEFVKIIYVIFLAAILSKPKIFKNIVVSGILAAIHVMILVASTDLGAALIFFIVYITMLYISTGKIRYFAMGIIAGIGASVAAYQLFSHVQARVIAWIDPWSIIDGKGYQITQSLFAIGTGDWFGIGFYQGLPTKIPVVEKDFVFSAIAEEFGIIFSICIILICFSSFIGIMKIATKSQDIFYKLLAAGLSTLYMFQCFLTIGGVTKFIPSTGVTLPFVSYGGSSILCSLLMFAVIQAVFILVKENEEYEK